MYLEEIPKYRDTIVQQLLKSDTIISLLGTDESRPKKPFQYDANIRIDSKRTMPMISFPYLKTATLMQWARLQQIHL